MEPPSSTSSSDRTLAFLPRVTRAGWVALAMALAGGVALRAVASPVPGVPPVAAFSGLDAEAYRYASATGRAGSEILLLGSSLMRYAVQEDLLADDLGARDLLVFNAALDGGRLWDVLRLVDSMPPSRAARRRLAILEVNRIAGETSILPHPYRDARLRAPSSGLHGAAEALWAQVPPRQDAVSWGTQAVYGAIARHLPALVPVPHPIPRVLWMLTPLQLDRATKDKRPADVGGGMHHTVWETPAVLPLLVAALRQHGFRVLILQTPMHGEMLRSMAQSPVAAASERAYRAAVLDPAATGADGVLAFDTTADIGGDDGMLADYGHLLPAGATLLTHRLATYLSGSPLWEGTEQ